jgi:hypothetical protein
MADQNPKPNSSSFSNSTPSSSSSSSSAQEKKNLDKVDLFPIFRILYDLILEFETAHEQFPKKHKFTLGKRLSLGFILALEQVISAIVLEETRLRSLPAAIVELEKTRILIRLSHDLKAIDSLRYEKFSRLIVSALEHVSALLRVAKKQSNK